MIYAVPLMDKGAHFHACDFQVHTPRDANWDGAPAITEAERRIYAAELIQACRARHLDAIAITDHHDFAFFPYVRQAALAEVDANGKPIVPEQQIVVFPGVELTLSSPPCQALLLMSSDFDDTKLADILTTLFIAETPAGASKLASVETVSPTSVTSLNDLETKLNLHKWLRGRFILLPNVTESGYRTLFREGFGQHYKEMHCVGGYVDGSYEEKTSVGKRNILEGRQQNNGYQPIAVFQTSDSRSRDHRQLGAHTTWVKWAEPTAEALRQACLAKESRLSLVPPALPGTWITSITVSNSRFLGRIALDLNQQYNAIIGGRGTGKSTILEYLRWGLCDEAPGSNDVDSVHGKRRSLIENTLNSFEGDVHVTFLINDVQHIVKRSGKRKELLIKIGSDPFVVATEDQIRAILPIQAYSQKQLSSVAIRIDELRRFVELPIADTLDRLTSESRDLQARARAAYGDLTRKRQLDAEIEKNDLEIHSFIQQGEALRQGLKGLSADDQKTINEKPHYDNEEAITDGLAARLEASQRLLASLTRDLANTGSTTGTEGLSVQNEALIAEVRNRYDEKFAELATATAALSAILSPENLAAVHEAVRGWQAAKRAFDVRYEAAKRAASSNEQQLEQIRAAEARIGVLRKAQADRRNAVAALGAPDGLYRQIKIAWDDLHSQRRTALEAQCTNFTALSNGLIRAEIGTGVDSAALTERLRAALAGTKIREDKVERLCTSVAAVPDPLAEWNLVLVELETLVKTDGSLQTALPDTPRLTRAGMIDTERQRIAAAMSPEKWIDLALTPLAFLPRFFYCTNKERAEFIAFADASAGQQATALLAVLLNQPGAPLIIDQPEDDIDSRMIGDIVEQVWKSKKNRQLIFASHSANFVVNGDAELVVCCDYVKAGDQTQGEIKALGAIDVESVRREITLVTEGGEQAFRLRKAKYGF